MDKAEAEAVLDRIRQLTHDMAHGLDIAANGGAVQAIGAAIGLGFEEGVALAVRDREAAHHVHEALAVARAGDPEMDVNLNAELAKGKAQNEARITAAVWGTDGSIH